MKAKWYRLKHHSYETGRESVSICETLEDLVELISKHVTPTDYCELHFGQSYAEYFRSEGVGVLVEPVEERDNLDGLYVKLNEIYSRLYNRYRFVNLMRRPEMALLRHALKYLKNENVDWQSITTLDVKNRNGTSAFGPSWALETEDFRLFAWVKPDISWASFEMYWTHVEDTSCKCRECALGLGCPTAEQPVQLPVEVIGGFIEWIVEAMEYVPLNNEAQIILDMLIRIQQENK